MKKLISNFEHKVIKLHNCYISNKFRRGDGGVLVELEL